MSALSRAQRAYDDQLPEDDLDFLDSYEGEELIRIEEEELTNTGCGRIIEQEDLWRALCSDRNFRVIRDRVIKEMMETRSFKDAAESRLRSDLEKRAEL